MSVLNTIQMKVTIDEDSTARREREREREGGRERERGNSTAHLSCRVCVYRQPAHCNGNISRPV